MITNSCLINLNPLSVVGLCLILFIYKLEKLSDQRFHVKLSLSSSYGNKFLSWNPSIRFEFQTPPPSLQNSSSRTPSPLLSLSKFKMLHVVGYGYFLESPNNLSLTWSDFSMLRSYSPKLHACFLYTVKWNPWFAMILSISPLLVLLRNQPDWSMHCFTP